MKLDWQPISLRKPMLRIIHYKNLKNPRERHDIKLSLARVRLRYAVTESSYIRKQLAIFGVREVGSRRRYKRSTRLCKNKRNRRIEKILNFDAGEPIPR